MNVRQWIASAALGCVALGAVNEGARGVMLAGLVSAIPGHSATAGHVPALRLPAGCRTLTDRQLASLVVASGWPKPARRTSFAVALAESGGRTCAVGDVALQGGDWGPSVCPWQIRSENSQRGTGGVRDQAANLASAKTCGKHAHELWASSGWRPWSTYNSGAYRKHLARAARAGL